MKNLNWKTIIQTYVAVMCCALFILPVQAGQVTYPDNSYTSGDTLTATDLNGKFNEVKADVNNNDDRIAALELLVAGLQTALAAKADASHTHAQSDVINLESDLTALQADIVPNLGSYLAITTMNGYPTALFSGINVQVVNSVGQTTLNGLGNLIVGYNQPHPSADDKSGSHNLVAGNQNNYSSYGGVVFGYRNTASGSYSSVTGGRYHTASGSYSGVTGGGESNTASAQSSSVSGGQDNTASAWLSSVTGGINNTASGTGSSVSGGNTNTASAPSSSVSGGRYNTASTWLSSVSGGSNNTASGNFSSVSGGYNNTSAVGPYDWAAGTLWEDQ